MEMRLVPLDEDGFCVNQRPTEEDKFSGIAFGQTLWKTRVDCDQCYHVDEAGSYVTGSEVEGGERNAYGFGDGAGQRTKESIV
ncbi:unnamed protein product [Cyprideis torosa]|uniref:Uncharacterized protein n=1 Tax=Cyprideis torosa TaxID=163714 RepID=A0A7R8W495_9CRUS|nr:unnamed protein product [Cyprideis torosa]CAG0883761.1 unnamed protein product [Cyprideis torosa]